MKIPKLFQPTAEWTEEVSVLTPEQAAEVVDGIYRRGDVIMTRFILTHLAIGFGLAPFYDAWVVTAAVGLAATLMFLVSVKLAPRTFITRVIAGISLQTFVALHIYQLHGMSEMHFFFFTAFTMMIVYCDWLAMWPGAFLIIGQHILFAILHNAGHDLSFFEVQYVSFTKLFFHFGIAIMQVAVCGVWAVLLRRRALLDAAQKHRVAASLEATRQAKEALREKSEQLANVLISVGEAVVVAGRDHRIVVYNRAAEQLFGTCNPSVRLEDWIRMQGFFSADGETPLDPGINPLVLALDGEAVDEVEVAMRRDPEAEPVWLSMSGRPVRDDSGSLRGGVIVCRDISQRKKAEEALERSEAQLRQAQRMDAIGRLAGGIAHDFNNLLTVITGYASVVVDEDDISRAREQGREILFAAGRAATLANQLLTFSRKQVTRATTLDLNLVLAGLDGMLRRIVGEDIRLRLSVDNPLPAVTADPGQLEQVIVNLVINARDAMPDGGEISIETTVEEISDAVDLQSGRYAVLSVRDTGSGMTAAVRSRIFEPFFTTKARGRGLGLGLSIVYGIATQTGGAVRVESEPGEGSTFRIYLPAATVPATAVSVMPAEGTVQQVLRGTETVLVVEDEDAVRTLVVRVLASHGYRTIEAGNGEDALRAALTRRDEIDMIVTDVVMPGLKGPDMAKQVRAVVTDVPVLFMSAYADTALQYFHDGDEAPEFIAKPFLPVSLLQRVREVLDRKQVAAPPAADQA